MWNWKKKGSPKIAYLALARFKSALFLQTLRERGVEGNLHLTSVVQNEQEQTKGDWIVPLLCSAECESDAVDVAACYAQTTLPGVLPDTFWIVMAPDDYVRTLPRKIRSALSSACIVQEEWYGPIECSRNTPELNAISDLIFERPDLPWKEYANGTFPKKTFIRPS
jgi:hypothetical protein